MPQDNTVLMEGVRILFRNFAGKEREYNREGSRNFAVLLDESVAEVMAADGWNIKMLKAREEDGEETPPQPILQVEVKYRDREGKPTRPPRIVLISSRGRTNLDENTVETLDWADITNVDLIVRPSEWAINGKSGIKAYLQSMYVTIEEDPLERKYAEMDEQHT